jgi:hypothetical protein
MVTLEQIRKKYEDLAKANTTSSKKFTVKGGQYPGTFPIKAYKTGNLRSTIRVLITSKEAGKVVLDLAAVRYSVFLNSGFRHYRSGNIIRRPFAAAAANDKALKQMINEYTKATIDNVILTELELVKGKLGKFGVGPKISPNSSTKRYTYP